MLLKKTNPHLLTNQKREGSDIVSSRIISLHIMWSGSFTLCLTVNSVILIGCKSRILFRNSERTEKQVIKELKLCPARSRCQCHTFHLKLKAVERSIQTIARSIRLQQEAWWQLLGILEKWLLSEILPVRSSWAWKDTLHRAVHGRSQKQDLH